MVSPTARCLSVSDCQKFQHFSYTKYVGINPLKFNTLGFTGCVVTYAGRAVAAVARLISTTPIRTPEMANTAAFRLASSLLGSVARFSVQKPKKNKMKFIRAPKGLVFYGSDKQLYIMGQGPGLPPSTMFVPPRHFHIESPSSFTLCCNALRVHYNLLYTGHSSIYDSKLQESGRWDIFLMVNNKWEVR